VEHGEIPADENGKNGLEKPIGMCFGRINSSDFQLFA
jgi:hypothetical protein